jgi:phosphatidylserine decarboxylase
MASKPTAQKEMLRFVVPLFLAFVALPFLMDALPLSRSGYVVLLFLLWIVLAMAIVFVMYFFRDPERALPPGDNLIVSAADGLVVGIDEMEEPDFHLGPMIRISVFLSVFDVHVNRAPCESTVKSTVYKAGKFLDVRHPQSSRLNECRSWRLETPHGDIAVRQIAGLIARRIVAWAGEGSKLARGQRFGMIRFGSRTEVFLPAECAVLVQLGDRVQGAATPIARWPETG